MVMIKRLLNKNAISLKCTAWSMSEQENTFCLLILIFISAAMIGFNDGFPPYDYSSGKIHKRENEDRNSKGVNKFLSCGEVGGYYVIENFIIIVKVSYPRHWRQLAPCDTWFSFMKMASTVRIYSWFKKTDTVTNEDCSTSKVNWIIDIEKKLGWGKKGLN